VSAPEGKPINEIQVDEKNLYREEIFTDLKVATIRILTPVSPDGTPDASREPLFVGQTQLMSQAGPLPVSCPIEGAKTLEEALARFPEAVSQAVDRLVEEARDIQRQEASRIVVPNVAAGGPGGSKIIS